ncbi:unnamed protein product [Clonostachys rhizophaga]|uniref:Uncharacterized protein n=1 Tax=Clonostachys rhizophaga TaxID=160324 RepID=A0A9N9YQW0_9HYPO|nr:unnamed protein product [Clonostachys rhizophaga]
MYWVNLTYYVAIKFIKNLSCMPQAQSLDKTLLGGKCINEKVLVARRIPRASRIFDFGPAS